MDEFAFLEAMYRRLNDMRRCYPNEDGVVSAAEAAVTMAIRDYLSMQNAAGGAGNEAN